jgi:hypothetical protein
MFNPFYSFLFNPVIPNIQKLSLSHDEPPTIYSLLNSYVNFGKEESEQVKIKDLAKTGRGMFFDFNYPLSSHINKEDFETLILNHYLMRRIGYETVTAFKIALSVKLSEIMPRYNKLFDCLDGWNLFQNTEVTEREVEDSRTSTTENTSGSTSESTSTGSTSSTDNTTSDRRYSDTPQNELQSVQNGSYVSQYNYDHNTGTNTTTNTASNNDEVNTTSNNEFNDSGNLNESITRTHNIPSDKIKIYQDFLQNSQNIYTMIFKDLDSLFYQLI